MVYALALSRFVSLFTFCVGGPDLYEHGELGHALRKLQEGTTLVRLREGTGKLGRDGDTSGLELGGEFPLGMLHVRRDDHDARNPFTRELV